MYVIEESEKSFVDKFIIKSQKDRLLFELSGKKRQDALGRFCHDTENIIKPDRIVSSGDTLFSDEILDVAKQYNVSGLCYIIAYNKDLDRRYATLNDALNLVLGNGMAAIILCDNLVVIETEQCFGTPMRYILH